jgi:hypothetical protein
MVKLYELRIGNFLEVETAPTHLKVVKRVREIKEKNVRMDDVWYHLDQLFPILLTEEILKRCGFTRLKWITETNVFEHGDINCKLDDEGAHVFGPDLNNLKPIKYLHELQNLYFDLSETELETDFGLSAEETKSRGGYVILSSNT